MSPLDLLRDFPHLSARDLAVTPDLVCIAAESTAPTAACPPCGNSSDRVHSRYTRTAADLPWQGRRVVLRLTVRRFRCRTPGCPRAVFGERLPAALIPHARTTDRLAGTHRAIGFALGGEAGSRLADRLAVPTSPDTLLRRVKAVPATPYPTPRILGVDDFAFRKGHAYGTILVDLERRCVVDLLPDRTAETLAAWLRAHPGVEVVGRDRASSYSRAAAAAAPDATQVADRFHLLVNLREAVERVFQARVAAIRAAVGGSVAPPPGAPAPPAPEGAAGSADRRRDAFERVRALHRAGVPLRRIARELGLHYRTAERYARSDTCPDWNPGRPRRSELDRHADYIRRRLGDGCRSAARIGRELAARGYRGAASVVRGYVRRLRVEMGLSPARPRHTLPAARPVPPSARRLSVTVVRRPTERTAEENDLVHRLKDVDPDTSAVIDLAESFAALVRNHRADGLDEWLKRAERSGGLRAFAHGLRRDEAAVRAGLSLPWSNGPVEGAVGRLKLIKRAGFGRAGFGLLKARVLNTG